MINNITTYPVNNYNISCSVVTEFPVLLLLQVLTIAPVPLQYHLLWVPYIAVYGIVDCGNSTIIIIEYIHDNIHLNENLGNN